MRQIWATYTERGQVTIPAEVRRALGLGKRGRVIFEIDSGSVLLKKPSLSLEEVFGSVPALKKRLSWKEMREIAHAEAADEFTRDARRK